MDRETIDIGKAHTMFNQVHNDYLIVDNSDGQFSREKSSQKVMEYISGDSGSHNKNPHNKSSSNLIDLSPSKFPLRSKDEDNSDSSSNSHSSSSESSESSKSSIDEMVLKLTRKKSSSIHSSEQSDDMSPKTKKRLKKKNYKKEKRELKLIED